MKYDFTTYYDRHGMDSIAVDPLPDSLYRKDIVLKEDIKDHIPMWVADMNFPTCPAITEAIQKRVSHPLFGYFHTSDAYYNAVINWHKERNGISGLTKENIGYENGVLGGVASALAVLAAENKTVLVNTPTYIGFTKLLSNNSYNVIHSPLVKDAEGIFRMDYDDMEKKIKEHNIRVAIFCSPHNPTGRVWKKEELEKAVSLFERNGVSIISDEIWSDIILRGFKHIPTQSVSEYARNNTVALYAPSKTFNLAGLIGSYHIIYNTDLKDRIDKQSSYCHYNDMNVLSMHALTGAYSKCGSEWTDELTEVISGNVDFACEYIRHNFKGISLSKPQGTYMLYLDCSDWLSAHGKKTSELLKAGYEAGVDWQDGEAFLCENTIRMNLALPKEKLEEAFNRLKKYVFSE